MAHARRYASSLRHYSSSSKQSSSDSGSKKVTASDGKDVVAVERPKSGSDKKKGRKKAVKPPAAPALPSVPDTNHLSPPAIALTSFFSLHRPISITDGFPSIVSDGTFASIFASNSESQASRDALLPIFSEGLHQHDKANAMIRTKIQPPDGGASIYEQVENALPGLFDQLNAMSGHFEPFRSPPTPTAEGQEASAEERQRGALRMVNSVSDMETIVEDMRPSTLRFKAIITIDKVTEADGSVNLVAHPDVFITPERDEQQREQALVRQQQRRAKYQLISVKRIRKLKMKKKKYKKLMKRTRNERRKLDRL